MKSIQQFLIEKLKISKRPQREFDFNKPIDCINELNDIAQEKGLIVKFRNRKTNQGDFCIFIYDKSKQSRYLIGYDGYYKKYPEYSFEKCFKMALDYIDKY